MNKSTTIYVVRHGESEGNIKKDTAVRDAFRKYGETGTPLTKLGKSQAHNVAKRLESIHFDAIFSSDMKRAVETAKIIATERHIQVVTNNTIRERNYGNKFWDLPIAQRTEMERGLKALSDEEKLHYRFFSDSETEFEALTRFKIFLDEIIPLYREKIILVVNHGNVMRTFLKSIGWAKYAELPSETIENTGYFVVETDGKTFTIKETWRVHKLSQGENNEA